MRLVIVFCIALVVAGCGDEARTTIQPLPPAATTKQSKSAAEVLALFKAEMGICTSAMQTFEKDRAFLDEYMDANKRESKPLADFLRNASFANSEDIQYILKNQKYFIVDVTFHPAAFAVVWVKNEPAQIKGGRVRIFLSNYFARLYLQSGFFLQSAMIRLPIIRSLLE